MRERLYQQLHLFGVSDGSNDEKNLRIGGIGGSLGCRAPHRGAELAARALGLREVVEGDCDAMCRWPRRARASTVDRSRRELRIVHIGAGDKPVVDLVQEVPFEGWCGDRRRGLSLCEGVESVGDALVPTVEHGRHPRLLGLVVVGVDDHGQVILQLGHRAHPTEDRLGWVRWGGDGVEMGWRWGVDGV